VSTSKDFAQEVADAFGGRDVTVRPMFGEYGFYCENKMVGLICDNTLFFKITPVGQDFAPELSTGSPYPGAKAQFVIPAEKFHESEWLNELLQLTWDALPFPKPKPAKKS
jgi:TfoX/Sxy family transcriptional regulator of competence genes